jgi:hypothetical protein
MGELILAKFSDSIENISYRYEKIEQEEETFTNLLKSLFDKEELTF